MENIDSGENVAEGTTPQDGDFVPLHEASDEELDAYLKQADSDESALVSDEVDEESTLDAEPDAKSESKSKDEPEAKGSEKDDPEKFKRELEELKEKHSRLLAHTKQVELWNSRQGTQLGEARKKLKELIAEKSRGLDERFLEKPTEALRDIEEIKKAEQNLQEIDEEEALNATIHESYEIVARNVKPEEFDIEAMGKVLEADGLDRTFISSFVQNPFAHAKGETLVQLSRRALAEKRLSEIVAYTKQLFEENKKLKEKPKNVLQNVERASRQTPSITASNGGHSGRKPSQRTFSQMSDTELQEFITANS